MPLPVSETVSVTWGPGRAPACAPASASLTDDVGGLDAQPPALGHGVAAVDHQIEQHLVHLRRIGHHAGQVRLQRGGELDVLADQASEHGRDGVDDGIQLKRHGLDDLLPAEGEQLLGEIRRLPAGVGNLGHL